MLAHCVGVPLPFTDCGHLWAVLFMLFRKPVLNWLCQFRPWLRKSFPRHSEWAQQGPALQSQERKREGDTGKDSGSRIQNKNALISKFPTNVFLVNVVHCPAVSISRRTFSEAKLQEDFVLQFETHGFCRINKNWICPPHTEKSSKYYTNHHQISHS